MLGSSFWLNKIEVRVSFHMASFALFLRVSMLSCVTAPWIVHLFCTRTFGSAQVLPIVNTAALRIFFLSLMYKCFH